VFGGSFGISLEGDCHEVAVASNLESLATFGMSLEGVYHELKIHFHYKLISNLEVTKISLTKAPSLLGMRQLRVWIELVSN
jgi:hypothetical protein